MEVLVLVVVLAKKEKDVTKKVENVKEGKKN